MRVDLQAWSFVILQVDSKEFQSGRKLLCVSLKSQPSNCKFGFGRLKTIQGSKNQKCYFLETHLDDQKIIDKNNSQIKIISIF